MRPINALAKFSGDWLRFSVCVTIAVTTVSMFLTRWLSSSTSVRSWACASTTVVTLTKVTSTPSIAWSSPR